MQIINYDSEKFNKYMNDLQMVGMLSSLFSDSSTPMLYYRATENLYCSNLGAENLARSDVPADAKYENIGIGIKTFLENNKKTYQKIEEFNHEHSLYGNLDNLEKVKKVSELRNIRLKFTMNTYNINKMIFHCIVRNDEGFHFYEEPMDFIDIDKITITKNSSNVIDFTDGNNNYKFNLTKSTLLKQFFTDEYFADIEVRIAENPLELITKPDFNSVVTISEKETLVLPLYTIINGEKVVAEKSGLNQWNAGGRKRNPNEVYIPYPSKIRNENLDFFPPRDESFDVKLPSGNHISMKVCQQGDKAIMSNPNKALGEWILREVLELDEMELLTYDKLLELGIDSVIFTKEDDCFKIDFKNMEKNDDIEENI